MVKQLSSEPGLEDFSLSRPSKCILVLGNSFNCVFLKIKLIHFNYFIPILFFFIFLFSDNLREALGLKNNQLPLFIYNMRVIGYPPGWMNEAVFEKSGLSLFDSDGKGIII